MPVEDELLAQFEQKSEQDTAAVLDVDQETYESFDVKDRRQLSLYIRPVGNPYQWISYRYLLHSVAAPDGSRLDLVFSFMLVKITGRHLLTIGDAIAKERCGFIQQFDPKNWLFPKDSSMPFIDSITFTLNAPSDLVR